MEKLELLLHPVRMRMVLALANRVLTTQQLADLLPDVAQTTLYRHINLLLEGEILTVVRESKVRGTVERELTLVKDAARISMEASAQLSAQEHERIFTGFIGALLADFKRAQSQPQAGIPPAFYTQHRLYLSVEELQRLSAQFDALLSTYKDASRPTTDEALHPWLFTGLVMPETTPPPSDEEQES